MASAVLHARNEPHWVEPKVYMRNYSNPPHPPHHNYNPNPSSSLQTLNSNPNTKPASGFNESSSLQKVSVRNGYVRFNVRACSTGELIELKKRLMLELDQVQDLKNRIELRELELRSSCNLVSVSNALIGKKKTAKVSGVKRAFTARDSKREAVFSVAAADTAKIVLTMMRKCKQILTKIMKHKHAWVFNTPVDVVKLGLHDYFRIIKNPMDLGTVRSKLEKKSYSSPVDFASDVRLTFDNAMLYNPKGQDVHHMAETLLSQFNELFDPAHKKFEKEHQKAKTAYESRREMILEEARKPIWAPSTLVPKTEGGMQKLGKLPKPKSRDLNKREMTYEEKVKLGESLQSLPAEKLFQLVQIVRKRNGYSAEEDDEIELDIETVDTNTLWKLDRFVCNYKKMENKNKKQGLIHNRNAAEKIQKSPREVREVFESEDKSQREETAEEIDIGEDLPMTHFAPVEIEKDVESGGSSSSSGGSSSGSHSRSSRSDSDDEDADSVQSPLFKSNDAPST
ncbi:NET domain [Dillenia turbinata]|uniref:NET domain n=1 Tax=Dillenia turbinata TaxID=194707 RepID=A0AAN8UWD4_9MAGN